MESLGQREKARHFERPFKNRWIVSTLTALKKQNQQIVRLNINFFFKFTCNHQMIIRAELKIGLAKQKIEQKKKVRRRLDHQFCTWSKYSLSCRSFCFSLPLSTSKNFFLCFPVPQSIQKTF